MNTSIPDIAAAAATIAASEVRHPLVVIDYVQKVAVDVGAYEEEIRMARVSGELKDLALTAGAPVFAISASDSIGIADGRRLRTQHLRGASALAYEADAVLVLNEKFDVVARHHLVYGSSNAERFRNYAVLSIEKNRGGMAGVDMEFRKRFDQARFERTGQLVARAARRLARVHGVVQRPDVVQKPALENWLMIWIAAGPRMTMNSAGRMQKISGKRIFTGTF